MDTEHALFIICQAINHLPREQGTSTPNYFAGCIRRSLAAKAAAELGSKLSVELQFRELKKMHQAEPTDMQIRDEIQKLVDRGHEPAKAYMTEINNG